jgi:2-aminoethylphosphonate-pyruvate transaminase
MTFNKHNTDKLLFTPGPLTTSYSVKEAMLHDAGSWHFEFNAIVKQVRQDVLEIAGVSSEQGYESVLMQGSGTYGVESVLATVVPEDGKLLVLVNGAYGERIVQMARYLKLDCAVLRSPENQTPDLHQLAVMLASDAKITHVAMVHCETTTGILNPLSDVARIVKSSGRRIIVDAMSSFGAFPINVLADRIDFLVTSPNKCIQGVPGFSIVIARRESLEASEGRARSLSLDIWAQLKSFEANGQFRYTPPTHAILAFVQALKELREEGGPGARLARYQRNHEVLLEGMRALGFESYLDASVQSCVITSFFYPKDSRFVFSDFYHRLSDRGFIIYPGKLTRVDCFRVGSIGHLCEEDIRSLLVAIRETLNDMGVEMGENTGLTVQSA